MHLVQGLELVLLPAPGLQQPLQLLLLLAAAPHPPPHQAHQLALRGALAVNLAAQLRYLLAQPQQLQLVRFCLLYDEVDFVLGLQLGARDAVRLLLVQQVVVHVGAPDGSVGRHQRHYVDPIVHHHVD